MINKVLNRIPLPLKQKNGVGRIIRNRGTAIPAQHINTTHAKAWAFRAYYPVAFENWQFSIPRTIAKTLSNIFYIKTFFSSVLISIFVITQKYNIISLFTNLHELYFR